VIGFSQGDEMNALSCSERKFLRRREAAAYLRGRYGIGSEKTLAKLACVGGGPEFHKAGVAALYEAAALDTWALAKIGPAQASTSDVGTR
jgi:hypothetical protein